MVGAGIPALTRLLSIPTQSFAEENWGNTLLLSTAAERDGDDFSDLFSLAAVDELVSRRGLRAPFLRVAKDGKTLPDSAFTAGGGIGAGIGDQVSDDKLMRLFADGATLVLQGLHRTWEPLVEFSQQLAADLGHPVQVNAYITPPQNQGFADHYDIHDVFVLQVHGEKRWIIHEPILDSPLRDQPWGERAEEVAAAAREPAALDTVLQPGDCLYLPRGYIHAAQALGGVTAHITIGVQQWTRHHLAEQLLSTVRAGLGDSEKVRACLPLGVDLADPDTVAKDVEIARAAILDAIRELPSAAIADSLRAKARSAQRAAPISPLAQLDDLSRLTEHTRVQLRPHLALDVIEPASESEPAVVRSRAGRFRVSAEQRHALEVLLRGEPVPVSELHDDAAEATAAATLLLGQGVATVVA